MHHCRNVFQNELPIELCRSLLVVIDFGFCELFLSHRRIYLFFITVLQKVNLEMRSQLEVIACEELLYNRAGIVRPSQNQTQNNRIWFTNN